MKTQKVKVSVVIEKTETGYSAFAEDYAIFTTAGTIPELMENTIEASNLFFEDQKQRIRQENIQFVIDFKQFFQYYKVINAKFLAQKIGMNESLLSQYVQGKKKPSDQQTNKILNGIHQIGRELTEIDLIHRP